MKLEKREHNLVPIICISIISLIALCCCFGDYGDNSGVFETELDFTHETVDNRSHPDLVIDALEDGPVFIQFTQNDYNCEPSRRMRPKVEDLIKEYRNNVVFLIININENEITKYFKNYEVVDPITDEEENEIFNTYDLENYGNGRPVTPVFVIITVENFIHSSNLPRFTVAYGEFKEDDAEKTKEVLADTLEYAIDVYH